MGRRQPDLIDTVETFYRLECDEPAWLDAVARGILPRIAPEGVGAAFIFDASDPHNFSIDEMVLADDTPWLAEELLRANSALPAPAIRAIYWGAPHLAELSLRVGGLAALAANPQWACNAGRLGYVDNIGLRSLDPSHVGVVVCRLVRQSCGVSAAMRRSCERLGAHLTAAFRLRRALRDQLQRGRSLAEGAEAVLAPDGKCVHAEGEARRRSARDALRAAALDIDRARGRLRRQSQDEALEIWRGLVDGTWSLVDHFDADGRRYLVAHRNQPAVIDPRRLSVRERMVAAWAALGHSNKLIAYELGLATGTVARHLNAVMRKLGLASRTELITLFSRMEPNETARPSPATTDPQR